MANELCPLASHVFFISDSGCQILIEEKKKEKAISKFQFLKLLIRVLLDDFGTLFNVLIHILYVCVTNYLSYSF